MYLKSLELHGFKSFPEKTVLQFDHGSTVIVGPNGSGKSNITDAMRWVLGELSSKSIRGSKMEDVIFIGADGYRQMNFAEVSVTFDDSQPPKRLNSEYDEITVTRRYYRSGESEYFINRKPVRLKDIYELFMNTGIGRDGYSIIGQGKIAEIISKKSDERRGIFEETAGISKYRYRKHESERRLNETEANMIRVADILNELEGRVGPLERASQKARRYIELFEQKKEADLSLWLYDMVKMSAEAEKLSTECTISAHELEITEDSISQLESQSERIFNASQDNKQEQSKVYEEIRKLQNTIHDLENKHTVLENDSEHSKANLQATCEALDKVRSDIVIEEATHSALKTRHADLSLDVEKTNQTISQIRELVDSLSDERNAFTSKISEAFDLLKENEAKRTDIDVRLGIIDNLASRHSEQSESISAEIEKYNSELAALDSRISEIDETIEEYRTVVSAADEELLKADKKINNKSDEIKIVSNELNVLNSEKSALESRIGALTKMLEHFEGFNNSVRYVMNESSNKRLSGIHGPVSHLISVPEKYTIAIETAMGSSLQGVVVENEDSAKAAMLSLKRSNSGRATFYPITSVKPRSRSRELLDVQGAVGFIGFANELINTKDIYSDVVSSLLGSITVFDNIDNATIAARKSGWKIRSVTLDGQQINSGGSFTGGSVRRDSGMLTRQAQIDKLKSDLFEKSSEIQRLNEKYAALNVELNTFKSQRAQTEERVKIVETMLRSESLEREELVTKKDLTSGLISQLNSDFERITTEKKSGDQNSATLRSELVSLKEAWNVLSAERIDLDSRCHDLDAQMDENNARINDLRVLLAEQIKDVQSIEADIAGCLQRLSSFNLSADEFTQKIKELEEAIINNSKLSVQMKDKIDLEKSALEEKEALRVVLDQESLDFEKKSNELRIRIRELTSKKELQFTAHSKNENKLQLLNADIEKSTVSIFDKYELTHAQAKELLLPEVTADNRSEYQMRLNELTNSIKALGHVNVDAISEYAEVKERYDYVSSQMNDLLSSKEELDSIISSIETEMENIFVDAFQKINKNFGEVFRELFGGGHAELTLTDPDDVLNCGIEISAAPPGKMIKNLSLLSGGEQAFVAIALMFALIKVNPSPFCIFDEIEAALDEVNVNRVANYISRFSKDIQIIMITHRRGTMEIADTLYGVTMPRRGVSKVFTLDVGAVAKQQFIDEHM